jgi:hypothetical protein
MEQAKAASRDLNANGVRLYFFFKIQYTSRTSSHLYKVPRVQLILTNITAHHTIKKSHRLELSGKVYHI